MMITFFMALAVLFGCFVLLIILVGRKYEVRHRIGELDEDADEMEELAQSSRSTNELNSKEKL